MAVTKDTKLLSHQGAMMMLTAAVEAAEHLGQPQCIVIVDASGQLIAGTSYDRSKVSQPQVSKSQSLNSSLDWGAIDQHSRSCPPCHGAATDGTMTGLPGGLPIIIDGVVLGGIGSAQGPDHKTLKSRRRHWLPLALKRGSSDYKNFYV